MIAVLVGSLFILFGLWGIAHWFGDFMIVLRGFIPISILLGGIIALSAGVSTFQNRLKNDKNKK